MERTEPTSGLQRLAGLLELPAETSFLSLTALIDAARKAGLDVRLSGDAAQTFDALAFRIVQEALTNALKHAGPTRVDVHLEHRPDELEVDITDHGRATSSTASTPPTPPTPHSVSSGGHGLSGMRERVALAGGTVTAGPTPEGGWEVTARVPAPRSLIA